MFETRTKVIGPVTVVWGESVSIEIAFEGAGGLLPCTALANLSPEDLHQLTEALLEIDEKLSPDKYEFGLADHVQNQLENIELGIRNGLATPPKQPVEVRFKVDADVSAGAPEVHFSVPIDFASGGPESAGSSAVSS